MLCLSFSVEAVPHVLLGVVICFSMVQSFTPYRTAQRPIVTATQVGSHIRVGEPLALQCNLLLQFLLSPFADNLPYPLGSAKK